MLEKIKESWQKIKDFIKEEFDLTQVSFNTWIAPLEVCDMTDDHILRVIYPESPSGNENFAVNYIAKKYSRIIEAAIIEVAELKCQVMIISKPEEKSALFINEDDTKNNELASLAISANLNPRYTFDTFVVGKNNSLAHAVSLSVAESPGAVYNPLFIYGGAGLGKTHLMHAIANFILSHNPKAKVLYVTSEDFTNELVDSIRTRSNNEFKKKYRGVDVLLIDDIQFIISKDSTQEEFFNTFNFLYENRKQIVISSDKPPKSFTTLEERLRSRFAAGVTTEINPPDYETRMAILRNKEEMSGFTIDNEILHYIATSIRTNIRELEGALTKINALSRLRPDIPLTLDIAIDSLKDLISTDRENSITPDHIIEVVAEHFGIRPDDIKSTKRSKEIAFPRQITMYLIRLMTDASLEAVGSYLGNRDHSTVSYGSEKIMSELDTNKELFDTVEILKKKLSI